MITRRTLFGFAMVPVAGVPAIKRDYLAPGHVTAAPMVLRINAPPALGQDWWVERKWRATETEVYHRYRELGLSVLDAAEWSATHAKPPPTRRRIDSE